MPKVRPGDAREAVIRAIPWVIGLFDALQGIEQGAHPIVAVKEAVKKAKKRKKKEKVGKRLRKKEKDVIDV